MRNSWQVSIILIAGVAAVSACFEIDLAGYRCDAAHACLDAFACVDGRCVRDEGEGLCGNATIEAPEQCDDGDSNDDTAPNACRSDCRLPSCGDLVTDARFGESCDDANDDDADGCDACASATCGNGTLDGEEQCDDGPGNSDVDADACRSNCALAFCGDEVVDEGEACDGDVGCDELCRREPGCGDLVVDPANDESCDDGNQVDEDDCRNDCLLATCGDGVIHAGVEQCDEGTANTDDAGGLCRTTCERARCGDLIVDAGETCDDGNTDNGDGCTPACALVSPVCGDGFVDAGESCDDGNDVDSDGCSDCGVTGGQQCFGEPSVCCAASAVRRVPGQDATIAAAVVAAGVDGCVFVSAGVYDTGADGVALSDSLTLVGAGAAVTTMSSSSPDGTMQILGNGTIAVVQGFTIVATAGNAVTSDVNNASLTLVRNVIGPAALVGVATIGANNAAILRQNLVKGCAGGGVEINGGDPWTLENNTIVDNGSGDAALGGVAVVNQGTFRHNTVARNTAAPGVAAGVHCTAAVTLFGSIIWNNETAPTSGLCSGSQSTFEGGGGSNISLDPVFVGGDDFHLTAGSPCLDRITASPTTSDIDFDPRPQVGLSDMGSDERR